MLGVVEEPGMEAVHAAAIGVPLQHHSLHVVRQHFSRHATERRKRVLVTPDQRLDALVIAELDIGHATPAECRNEHRQTFRPVPDRGPIRLHLLTWLRLEPDNRFGNRRWYQRAYELLHPR